MGAVEEAEGVLVGREVRRDPIEDDADPLLMQVIDQVHEVLGRAETGGRREVARGLITPGASEGMLHHGQELYMSEAQPLHVVRQPRREFSIREGTVALARIAHPGAVVNLVDGDRGIQCVASRSGGHPATVAPLVVQVPNHRGGLWRFFAVRCERIRLFGGVALVSRGDEVLVRLTVTNLRDEPLPDAGVAFGL